MNSSAARHAANLANAQNSTSTFSSIAANSDWKTRRSR